MTAVLILAIVYVAVTAYCLGVARGRAAEARRWRERLMQRSEPGGHR